VVYEFMPESWAVMVPPSQVQRPIFEQKNFGAIKLHLIFFINFASQSTFKHEKRT
jgi:hypothetical protein